MVKDNQDELELDQKSITKKIKSPLLKEQNNWVNDSEVVSPNSQKG